MFEIFQTSSKVKKLAYLLAENLPTENLPYLNIFNRTLSNDEYGLGELLIETGLHTNPRNNGLIVFPVSGLIRFDFIDCKVDVNSPTIINGRSIHNYLPLDKPSIFFAIKIPLSIHWEQVTQLL